MSFEKFVTHATSNQWKFYFKTPLERDINHDDELRVICSVMRLIIRIILSIILT
jgi:hypothetical protein